MEKNYFWEQILPRLLAVVIFSYLVYALAYKQEALSTLHVWILLIVLILSILPMAGRLRIPGIIDFNAKFDAFKQETQREISEIKAVVNSVVQTQTTAEQRQLSIFHVGELGFKDLASIAQEFKQKEISSIDEQSGVSAWNKKEFLSTADRHLVSAFSTFFIARGLQIAQKKERMPNDVDYPNGNLYEKTSKLLDGLLSDGIGIFVPAKEAKSTEANLEQIRVLITTCDQVSKGKANEPTLKKATELCDKVDDGIKSISAGCVLLSAYLAVFRINTSNVMEELRTKYLGNNTDDSPDMEKV